MEHNTDMMLQLKLNIRAASNWLFCVSINCLILIVEPNWYNIK